MRYDFAVTLTWHFETGNERVAREARSARAYGVMMDGLASRVRAAQSGTGVATFILDAGQIESALGADCAFGTAVRRASQEGGQAGADARVIRDAAPAVGSAG